MDELEPLKPYLKEIYNTLGKPVADRLVKVLKRYGPGLIKYPVRMIERKDAEAEANTKARIHEIERKDAEAEAMSEAHIKLIQDVTQSLTENKKFDPEYVKQVLAQGFSWTFNEVENFNMIVGNTVDNLLNNPPLDDVNAVQPDEEISDDWLNQFRKVACNKSSEDAQELFSKVLAGEIRKPGSFSLKALTTLADMDQTVALYFKVFCSMSLVLLDNPKMYHITHSKSHFKIKDARVPIIKNNLYDDSIDVGPRYRNNFLKAVEDSKNIYLMYGLRFEHFNLLMEHNLIVDQTSINSTTFWYNNEHWGVLSPDAYTPPNDTCYRPIKLTGYALTNVGKELYHIVDFKTPPAYWERISKFLKNYYNVNLYKYPNLPNKPSPEASPNQTIPDKND